MKTFTASVLALLLAAPTSASADLHQRLDALASDMQAEVVAWRRDIHQHPELSNRETRTARLVAEHLRALGLEVETGIAHTGVVGILRGGRPGKTVALRADMDALPVQERTGLAFASTATSEYQGRTVPVMHACGHDNHVAILMATASVLADVREELAGTVKFIFQPAEEGPPKGEDGGASMMIRQGTLQEPDVDAIYGLHIGQQGPAGTAMYRPKGAMASAQRFDVTIQGRQTHGARPWAGVDPVVVGAQIVVALQTIVSRSVDVTAAPAVVTVGQFNAGVRNNIVPDKATLSGTIRTFDPDMRTAIHKKIRDIATGVATSMGAEATVEIDPGVPVTFNDAELTAASVPTLERVYGRENIMLAERITGAEDFSFYQEEVPGFFFFIGGRAPGVPPEKAVPNHSPFFDADESALVPGVRAMSHLAVDFLSRK